MIGFRKFIYKKVLFIALVNQIKFVYSKKKIIIRKNLIKMALLIASNAYKDFQGFSLKSTKRVIYEVSLKEKETAFIISLLPLTVWIFKKSVRL